MRVAAREARSSQMVSKEGYLADQKCGFITIPPIQHKASMLLDHLDVKEWNRGPQKKFKWQWP